MKAQTVVEELPPLPSHISTKGLGRDTTALVRLAIYCGWTARNTRNGGVVITAPEPYTSIRNELGASIRESLGQSVLNRILKYGTPHRVMEFGVNVAAMNGGLPTVITSDIGRIFSTDDLPATVPPGEPEPTVVSEGPWLARKGLIRNGSYGRYYESEAVLERKWSNGRVDYRCAFPDCDYDNASPRSVSRHWGNSKTHPVLTDHGRPTMNGPAYEPGPSPTARVDGAAGRIAQELRDALLSLPHSLDTYSPEALAEILAEIIAAARAKRREDAPPAASLTPEQTLERIRQLVDDGSYLRRAEQERLDQERIGELEAALAAERAEREQQWEDLVSTSKALDEMRGEWHALQELISKTQIG